MSVLFFWRGDNYTSDMATGKGYHLNQNNSLMPNLKSGQHIWAFTRVGTTYVLAADLVVTQTRVNPPGYKYGEYRALADRQTSRYFDVDKGPNAEPVIRSLSFAPRARILGHSFQGRNGVRLLSAVDEQKLEAFSASLPVLP